MNQSEIFSFAGQAFQSKLDRDGDGLDVADIQAALAQLLSDGDGNLNLAALLENMNLGSLGSIAASWLGDGSNSAISATQMADLLDADKLSAFASKLGISEGSALNGLTEAIPAIVDKSSSGGSLIDSLGGMDGLLSMAGKLFR